MRNNQFRHSSIAKEMSNKEQEANTIEIDDLKFEYTMAPAVGRKLSEKHYTTPKKKRKDCGKQLELCQ